MLRFTSHSNWVQETTKMVCLQPRMKGWKLHCLQRCWQKHPNTVKQPGLHLTARTNRPGIPCLPCLLLASNSTSVQGEGTRPSVHKAPQQGDATRPPPNSMPAQVGNRTTRPSVSTGPKQREATRLRPNRIPEQTINAVFTQSSKASQGDAAHPPPTFSLNQKRTTHPLSSTQLIREKHPATCYRPPHLNRAEQTKQSRLNFRRLLRVVFLFSATSE